MRQYRSNRAAKLASDLADLFSNLGIIDLRRIVRLLDKTLRERIEQAESDILRHRAFNRPDKDREVSDFLVWYQGIQRFLFPISEAIAFATGNVDDGFNNPDVWHEDATFIWMIGSAIAERLNETANAAQAKAEPQRVAMTPEHAAADFLIRYTDKKCGDNPKVQKVQTFDVAIREVDKIINPGGELPEKYVRECLLNTWDGNRAVIDFPMYAVEVLRFDPPAGAPIELSVGIDDIIRRVAELPDRTSPEGWPEAMIVTTEELRQILSEYVK